MLLENKLSDIDLSHTDIGIKDGLDISDLLELLKIRQDTFRKKNIEGLQKINLGYNNIPGVKLADFVSHSNFLTNLNLEYVNQEKMV